ncbi:MAG: hypothetical protein ACOCUV_02985 [bacterium]
MIDKKSFFTSACISLVMASIFISSYSLFNPYSYWWDELYSVVGSSRSIKDIFNVAVLNDVHPPLYYIFLKYWIDIFGDHEISTRFSSFILCITALLTLYVWSSKRFCPIISGIIITFYSSSYLFIYYAQETRSYGMLLFFSTILTIIFIDSIISNSNHNKYYLITFLLLTSLTHYFGLIYSGTVIIILIYVYRNNFKQILLLMSSGILVLIWPTIHFLYGSIGETTGNNFWIKSNGIQTTITKLTTSLFPEIKYLFLYHKIPLSYLEWIITIIVFLIILIFVIHLFYFSINNTINIHDEHKRLNQHLVSFLILFIFIISIIDYHSPISTDRNFIVILPLFSILFGIVTKHLFKSNIMYITLIVFFVCLSHIAISYSITYTKIKPLQNHKKASLFISEKIKNNKNYNLYYLKRSNKLSYQLIPKFYLNKYINNNIKVNPILLNDINKMSEPFIVFLAAPIRFNIDKIIYEIKKSSRKSVYYFEPKQSFSSSVIVIYSTS